MTADWRPAGLVSELADGEAKVARTGGEQVALFRRGDEIFAIANRCPHEGYPLVTGTVKGPVLTCEWHNWKFRLCDGVCDFGGEDVRSYPVRIDGDQILIDLAEPAQRAEPLYASLAEAIDEADWGHAARTIARLRQVGQGDRAILGWCVDWAARHSPYGFDHGCAAAADLAALLPLVPGDEEVVLLQALQLLCEPHVRRPARDWPAPDAGQGSAERLRQLLDDDDRPAAEGLLRGAVAAGVDREQLLGWITEAVTDHFYGFGHGHIYTVKAEELLDAIGWDYADPVLTSLVTRLAYSTREDRLPYMRSYHRAMAAHDGRLRQWAEGAGEARAELDVDGLLAAVLDGSLGDAVGAVAGELDRGVAPDRIALLLAVAAGQRILRFDPEIDRRQLTEEGWLNVTHTMTHADAVRESLLRRPSPAALRGLFHSARFIQHMRPLDAATPEPPPPAPDADALFASCLDDALTLPIFVAHHVKTAACARRLTRAIAGDPQLLEHGDAGVPLAATARFLSQRMDERRISRRARIARRFVVDGEMHDKILGY